MRFYIVEDTDPDAEDIRTVDSVYTRKKQALKRANQLVREREDSVLITIQVAETAALPPKELIRRILAGRGWAKQVPETIFKRYGKKPPQMEWLFVEEQAQEATQ